MGQIVAVDVLSRSEGSLPWLPHSYVVAGMTVPKSAAGFGHIDEKRAFALLRMKMAK
jgi:hypothetical protein